MRSSLAFVWLFVAIFFLLVSGCGKEVTELIDQVKGTVEKKVERVVENFGMVKLNFAQSVETRACHVRLYTFNSDRPSIFQLTSYKDPQEEQSPSVMMTAQVDADSLEKLLDQTIQAEVFVKPSEGGEIWHSGTSQFVEIRITSVGNNRIAGEIVSGSLANVASGEESAVTGNFDGIVN